MPDWLTSLHGQVRKLYLSTEAFIGSSRELLHLECTARLNSSALFANVPTRAVIGFVRNDPVGGIRLQN